MQTLTDSDLSGKDKDDLNDLFKICFGGLPFFGSPPAYLRAVHRVEGKIIGHAAVSLRQIDLQASRSMTALLGLVCVAPDARGAGLGHDLIASLHTALPHPFILNCGTTLVGYYARVGYTQIANQAAYLRSGRVEIDTDPVLLNPNGCAVSTVSHTEPIYLGSDF